MVWASGPCSPQSLYSMLTKLWLLQNWRALLPDVSIKKRHIGGFCACLCCTTLPLPLICERMVKCTMSICMLQCLLFPQGMGGGGCRGTKHPMSCMHACTCHYDARDGRDGSCVRTKRGQLYVGNRWIQAACMGQVKVQAA